MRSGEWRARVRIKAVARTHRTPAANRDDIDARARLHPSGPTCPSRSATAHPFGRAKTEGNNVALATALSTESPVKVMVVLCPTCAAQTAQQTVLLDQPARPPIQLIQPTWSTLNDEDATWEDAEWQ